MNNWPREPTDEEYAELGTDPQAAVREIEMAWGYIDYLLAQLDKLGDYDQELRGHLAAASFDGGVEPRGFHVYTLFGDNDEILYIGRSSNLFVRLVAHMSSEKWPHVRRVGVVRCPDLPASKQMEMAAIRHHRPRFNIIGLRQAG